MQEQGRLKQFGNDVGPVDRPVEVVQLSRVMEREIDKRAQAKKIKVRGFGGRPAPEQNVETDAEINERNEPQTGVERPVVGYEDDRNLNRNAVTDQVVLGLGVGADAKELLGQGAYVLYVVVVDRGEQVAQS